MPLIFRSSIKHAIGHHGSRGQHGGLVAPKLLAGAGVKGVYLVAGGQVIDAVYYQGREVTGGELFGVEAPNDIPRGFVQGIGLVYHGQVHHSVNDGGRRLYITAYPSLPRHLAGGGVQGVELPVFRTLGVHPVAYVCWRMVGADGEGIFSYPGHLSGGRVDGMDPAVASGGGAKIDLSAANGGRILDPLPGIVLPHLLAGAGVQGVDVVVVGAEVHYSVNDSGNGADNAAGSKAPQQFSGIRGQRVKAVVVGTGVHHAVSHGRSDEHQTAGGEGPDLGRARRQLSGAVYSGIARRAPGRLDGQLWDASHQAEAEGQKEHGVFGRWLARRSGGQLRRTEIGQQGAHTALLFLGETAGLGSHVSDEQLAGRVVGDAVDKGNRFLVRALQ